MNNRTKLVIFSFIIFLISCKSNDNGNDVEKESFITPGAMLKDFDLFQNIYKKANAGLYKYRTKKEIDSVFTSNRQLIKDNLSYREFYNLLWNLIDYTGSCHNNLAYPDSLDAQLNKQKIFFPIPLKYVDGKLYSNIEYKTIPVGSEIIAINGIPQHQFSNLISRYVSTDGFNKTGKYANIGTDWLPFYIYLAIGKQDEFVISYKVKDSKISKEKHIESVTYSEFYSNFKNRHSKDYENRFEESYSYKLLDSINAGLLSIQTFALGGPGSQGHKEYASFLDSVFTTIKNNKTENLIVDIRGNGGGNDPNDILLYSYLAQRNFRENKTAFTIFQDIPFSQYYADDDIEELPIELKEEHSIYKDGKYHQNDGFNKTWEPKQNAFKGKLVLLVDPFVASAGSLFASLVKSDSNTIVIGEETLGGYYGHTGHIPVTYQLPNSQLLLTFSIVDLEQDVRKLKDQKNGQGIIPDYRVVQSYEDFINNTDTQLNFAIEKIKKL